MIQERKVFEKFRRFKDSNGYMPIQEFMKIRDLEETKTAIAEVFRERVSNPTRNEIKFSPEEIDEKVEHVLSTFDYAAGKHTGKKRLTGEDYIFHPAAVTYMTIQDRHISINELTEVADTTLCHDILEDTSTFPRELKEKIGAKATRNVILLSKNMKVFDHSPNHLARELNRIGPEPTEDEIELRKWAKRIRGTKIEKLQAHMEELLHAPIPVKLARIYDRRHNLLTLPPLNVPGRSEEDEAKVKKIWVEIESETRKDIIPIAASLGGLAGYALVRNLKSVLRENKRSR